MNKLADFVIDTVDNCEDIRDWLKTHTDYKTPKLMPEIDSAESDETELTNEKYCIEPNDLIRKLIFSKNPSELINRMKQRGVEVNITQVDKGAYSLWVEP